MRRYIFSFILTILPIIASAATEDFPSKDSGAIAATQSHDDDTTSLSRYDKRIHRMRHNWGNLIPTQLVIQNAGNMGFLSVGVGWEYGKKEQWETHLLFGFIPSYKSDHARFTMTLKENFIPWSISLNDKLALEPLSTGLYVNTVYGNDFWGHQPSRYPDKYYEALSTKFRFNVFLGQRLTFTIPDNRRKWVKGITAFYEVSTCDLYIRAIIKDSAISLWDILGLSLGVKVQIF